MVGIVGQKGQGIYEVSVDGDRANIFLGVYYNGFNTHVFPLMKMKKGYELIGDEDSVVRFNKSVRKISLDDLLEKNIIRSDESLDYLGYSDEVVSNIFLNREDYYNVNRICRKSDLFKNFLDSKAGGEMLFFFEAAFLTGAFSYILYSVLKYI